MLAKFWFGFVANLKFGCLVQTGVVALKTTKFCLWTNVVWKNVAQTDVAWTNVAQTDVHGQMLHGKMLHGQMVLGHLSIVKDGSTNLKCPPWYFLWGGS